MKGVRGSFVNFVEVSCPKMFKYVQKRCFCWPISSDFYGIEIQQLIDSGMSLRRKVQVQQQMDPDTWNCFPPHLDKAALFLTHSRKSSRPLPQSINLSRVNKGVETQMTNSAPPKISLKNKKQKQLLRQSMGFSNAQQGVIKGRSSLSNTPSLTLRHSDTMWHHHHEKAFYEPELALMTSRLEQEIVQLKLGPSTQRSAFLPQQKAPLAPPPIITFTHNERFIQKKLEQSRKTEQKYDSCIKKGTLSGETTVFQSGSQSFNTKAEKTFGLERVKTQFKLPPSFPSFEDEQVQFEDMEIKYSRQVQVHAPKGNKSKQEITQSLLTSIPQSKEKEAEKRQQSRSFCSQKFIKKNTLAIMRMSDVQQIKSQVDSQQYNDDDNQSIVLGRLQELANFPQLKHLQGSSVQPSKNHSLTSSTVVHQAK